MIKTAMRDALAKYVPNPLQEAMARFDAWVNQATGFGTLRDKTTYGRVQPLERINDVELSALYHTSDIAARMVDVVPQEMLREGFGVDLGGDIKLNTMVAEKLDNLTADRKFADGVRWGRLYGGAALLIGADDGRPPEKPLIPERARDIDYLYVIERRVLWPVSYYSEPGHPKLGEPETYMVTPTTIGGGGGGRTTVVHESQLIIFRGAKTGAFERIAMAGWDVSVLQRAYEVIRSFDTGWKAVETLLTDGNQAIFKMTGLADMIASGQQDALRKRLNIIELYRSVMRALVIDADSEESYERTSVSMEGIPLTLDRFMLRLAAAVQIPVTILMGQSPAGMNATGESDFRWFYDRIRAEQTTELAPKIRRLVDIWLRTKASPIGRVEPAKRPTITVTFPALWTPSPVDEATRRKAIADADCAYIDHGVYLPEEVAATRSRPEGYDDGPVRLSDAARAARAKLLGDDLAAMAAGTPPVPVAPTSPTGAGAAAQKPKAAPPPTPAE